MDADASHATSQGHFRLMDLPRDVINHVFLQIPVYALIACRTISKSIAALPAVAGRQQALCDCTEELLPYVRSVHYLRWLVEFCRVPVGPSLMEDVMLTGDLALCKWVLAAAAPDDMQTKHVLKNAGYVVGKTGAFLCLCVCICFACAYALCVSACGVAVLCCVYVR